MPDQGIVISNSDKLLSTDFLSLGEIHDAGSAPSLFGETYLHKFHSIITSMLRLKESVLLVLLQSKFHILATAS